jgi:anti-sigma factor RsiW
MRDCARYAPMIGARAGELSDEEGRALSAHLAGCARCRAQASDLAATDGLVAEGLLARAAARDFAPFVDQVMARIAPSVPAGPLGWFHDHWKATLAALAPALAALALFLYFHLDAARQVASLELSAEGVSTVIQTSDGPVVLLADDDLGS